MIKIRFTSERVDWYSNEYNRTFSGEYSAKQGEHFEIRNSGDGQILLQRVGNGGRINVAEFPLAMTIVIYEDK